MVGTGILVGTGIFWLGQVFFGWDRYFGSSDFGLDMFKCKTSCAGNLASIMIMTELPAETVLIEFS